MTGLCLICDESNTVEFDKGDFEMPSNNKTKADERIDEIIRLMQRDDSIEAPESLVKWAHNLFRSRVAQPKQSLLHKVIAVLRADLLPDRAAFGERSTSASGIRQMLFEAGDNAIDLRIGKTAKGLSVHGQILGDGFEGSEIALKGQDVSFETRSDELSEFRFDAVPSGSYSLRIRKDEVEIVVDEMKLA